MMEDDKLISSFFEQNKQAIANNGFSKRVMKRLPKRTGIITRALNIAFYVVAITLFWLLDGASYISSIFVNLYYDVANHIDAINLSWSSVGMILVTVVILISLTLYDMFMNEYNKWI